MKNKKHNKNFKKIKKLIYFFLLFTYLLTTIK